jgi:L-amino acid N-acyltransferase YncA
MSTGVARLRLAAVGDAAAMLAIYAPIVTDSIISFELAPPSPAEMERRIASAESQWPWLVCERAGELIGYAYASQHRVRAAYQWSADTSVYVRPDARRGGIARSLYASLFEILALQGYYNAYAGITLPNPASVGFHESMGFTPVGVYRGVGYKLGAWHDVGWWARELQPHAPDPAAPISLAAARASPRWVDAIETPWGQSQL